MKKRILPLFLALVLLLAAVPVPARAAEGVVYVTIADMGNLKLVRYPVPLVDKNGNGFYDIDDALLLAHNQETGQMGGYSSSRLGSVSGIWISILWSRNHAGWVGYTVNGVLANSAEDPVKAGDEIYAWNYYTTDFSEALRDVEGYFDSPTAPVTSTVKPGEELTLTLDPKATANGAQIKVYPLQSNGWKLDTRYDPDLVEMDSDGSFTVTFEEAGAYCVTAAHTVAAKKALVPPYRVVYVRDFVYGDVDGDGAVSMMDATRLSRLLADWDVTADPGASDVDGDGAVNMTDVTLLRRYLAGWDVTLGPV